MKLAGRTALVTGGSGFIGGRLIEVLVREHGMTVRTLVRATASAGGGAFRAAAAGAEMVFGSLLDDAALAAATEGADFVFHCAYGTHGSPATQREVTVEGTRRLARAAAARGVAHFVHLGTVASYGGDTPAVVPEDFDNPRLWPWPYAHDKRDAERALAEEAAAGAMAYTVLRLGMVYGPYGGSYTVTPLAAMRGGRMALANAGEGISNATYVDDVVQAMLLAAQREASGDRFMIRGPDQVTWREFYGRYERMLGVEALVGMTRAEAARARRAEFTTAARRLLPETLGALKASAGFRRSATGLGLRTLYQKLGGARLRRDAAALPVPASTAAASDQRPIQLIPDMMFDYYANASQFSIDKAVRELGYAPRYDLAAGMALTEQWARWANLID